MSESAMDFSLSIYLIGAVFFAFYSKKCFMEKWQIGKVILCFLLSPSVGYGVAFALTLNCWEKMFDLDSFGTIIWNVLTIEGVQVLVLLIMMLFYVKLVHAQNRSISVFIYLCSSMFIPSVYFLVTSLSLIPYFLYVALHFLFYFTTVKPLSKITRTKQITDAKLFVILPVITCLFNAIIHCFYFYTSKLAFFDETLTEEWRLLVKSGDEKLAASALDVLRVFRDYMIMETEIILYPSIFISFVLVIAFYVIVRNIKFMNEAIEAKEALKELSVEVMEALAHTIDAKDEYTKGHSIRVAQYSKMIAKRMNFTEEQCENIYYMGLLHDLGKIGVPNEIINKPKPLTDEEYNVIKQHPGTGYGILSEIKSRPDLAIGARWHHERYDGTGYPDKKKGEEIPIEARIIAVADAYDAMTSNRSYRNYLAQDVVRQELVDCSGTQLDGEVAKAMIALIDEDKEYKMHE